MKYVKNVLFIFLILITFSIFTGCEKQEETIVFDDEYPLALSPSVNWAVVREPYAAYREECSWTSSVIGHCRRGEILQVVGSSIDADGDKWCHFENGWLPSSCLNIYSNRLKAERVADILIETEEK